MKAGVRVATLAALVIGMASGCSSMTGTYSDPMGSVLLELKSGGKANLTFMGQIADCTYTTASKQITLNCAGDATPTVFTVHDDGTLTGPPGSFMPSLRKQK